jgi:hypothetical protein
MIIDKFDKEPESSIISQINKIVDDSAEKANILMKLLKVFNSLFFQMVN